MMNIKKTYPIIGLMATRPSIELMLSRSLPSILSQSKALEALVIVSDSRKFTNVEIGKLRKALPNIFLVTLYNQSSDGAAGSWNTGLNWIHSNYFDCYVALLDDDDLWDKNHLDTCWYAAQQNYWPDIVVSGLRIFKNGKILNKTPVTNVAIEDFLTGNPGWQGSNTFVKSRKLKQIGGFTAGLRSCNDRDLAIRLLETPNITTAYTQMFTATWYCEERNEALSTPGSVNKLEGLAYFLAMHKHRMTPMQKAAFFRRAEKLFQFTQVQIIQRMSANALQRKLDNELPPSSS